MFSFRNRGNYESSVYTIDFIIIRVIVKKKKKKSHHVFEDLALTVRYASRVPRLMRVEAT